MDQSQIDSINSLLDAFKAEWDRAPFVDGPHSGLKLFCVRDILTEEQFVKLLAGLLRLKVNRARLGVADFDGDKYLIVA